MGEDLEAVVARDGDERDAGGLGRADRQGSRRRNGDEDTGAPIIAAFCTSSTETRLVSTTMPSLDVSPCGAPGRRRACRARCGGRRPRAAQRGPPSGSRRRRHGRRGCPGSASGRAGSGRQGIGNSRPVEQPAPCPPSAAGACASASDLDAAKAAADGTGQIAAAIGERRRARPGEAHAQLDANVAGNDVERLDLVGSRRRSPRSG